MADIFISYAREDLEKVRPIVRLIEAAGWSAFRDRTIPAGMTWRQHIGRALDDAKCVIVVWSKYSVESKFVQEEPDDGNEREILIPVLVEKARPPLGFRSIQHEDLSDWKGDPEHPGAKSLLKSIEGIAGEPEKHPSVPPAKPKSGLWLKCRTCRIAAPGLPRQPRCDKIQPNCVTIVNKIFQLPEDQFQIVAGNYRLQ